MRSNVIKAGVLAFYLTIVLLWIALHAAGLDAPLGTVAIAYEPASACA